MVRLLHHLVGGVVCTGVGVVDTVVAGCCGVVWAAYFCVCAHAFACSAVCCLGPRSNVVVVMAAEMNGRLAEGLVPGALVSSVCLSMSQ